jgi:peptidoglycan/LPS O-acetylase OafA/YrhL
LYPATANSDLKTERSIENRGFNDALLSLRGIAAFAVLIFHGMLVFKVDGLSFGPYDFHFLGFAAGAGLSAQFEKLIVLLTNGHAAVTFFLVHSGFVLAISISRLRWGSGFTDISLATLAYFAKRFFRLWPMIVACCVMAFLYQEWGYLPQGPAFSDWFNQFFRQPTGFEDLVRNIGLQRVNLVPVLWSLVIETYGSILMPLFVLMGRRVITSYLMLVVFYFLHVALPDGFVVNVGGWLFSYLTPVFMFAFVVGTLTAFIRVDLPCRPSWISQNTLVYIALTILISARWLIPSISAALILECLAASVIVYSVYYHDEGSLQWFCNLPIVKFYGKISYSLYVNSLFCIYLSGGLLAYMVPVDFILKHGLLMNVVSVAVTVVLATPLSTLTFRYIEAPLMNFGRQIAKIIEARAIEAPISSVPHQM